MEGEVVIHMTAHVEAPLRRRIAAVGIGDGGGIEQLHSVDIRTRRQPAVGEGEDARRGMDRARRGGATAAPNGTLVRAARQSEATLPASGASSGALSPPFGGHARFFELYGGGAGP